MPELPAPVGTIDESTLPLLDVGGVTVRPLATGDVFVLRGTIPPGRAVPLHTHPDPETFMVVSGAVEGIVLSERGEGEWTAVEPGGGWHVPPGLRHAWRNPTDEDAVLLLVTTPNLGEWFLDAGQPVPSLADVQWPPTGATLTRMGEAAQRHSLWIASPEENAAIGVAM